MPDVVRAALIRQGDRPRLNAALAPMLAETFPELALDDIDVLEGVRGDRFRYLRVAIGGLFESATSLVRRSTSAKRAIVSSTAYDRAVRELVERSVRPDTHRFTFQSQSLFDAAVDGVPHFVYTDHAHLANLGYPGFDRAALKSSSYLRREADLYRRAARVFTRSRHVADVIAHGYGCPPDKIVVVGCGPNVEPPSDDTVEQSLDRWNGGRIVFVGVDWVRKGGPDLVAAFDAVRQAHPDARLEIVGCRPPGVRGPGITVHGTLSTTEVAGLLEQSDIFCLPTLAEPFGVAFIEAMHAGLPVVGTDLGAVPDFIEPNVTGALVEPGDQRTLAAMLSALVADPAGAREMGRHGREVAQERYTWRSVMSAIRNEIGAVVDLDGGGR